MRPLRRLAVAALAALTTLTPVASAPAVADGPSAAPASSYYVAMGDSLSVGHMPTGDTDQGYVDDVYATLKASHPGLTLVKFGCSGETTQSLIHGGVCRGRYAHGSQLADAVAFLAAHRGSVDYLSLDIGANDVSSCADTGTVEIGCAATAVITVVQNLHTILARLHAADPDIARTVGLTYYDPFLAAELLGPAGASLAQQSLLLEQTLNLVETGIYGAYGYHVADVATAFSTTATTPRRSLAGFGSQPANVAVICTYTHMCAQRDIHPTAAGYAIIGRVVAAELS